MVIKDILLKRLGNDCVGREPYALSKLMGSYQIIDHSLRFGSEVHNGRPRANLLGTILRAFLLGRGLIRVAGIVV